MRFEMKDILDKEGLQILDSIRTTAKLLNYSVEEYISGGTRIRKVEGLKVHIFVVNSQLEISLYNEKYSRFSINITENYEENKKALKEVFELL